MRKSWLFLFSLVIISIIILFFSSFNNLFKQVQLGLDLQGGFEILYEVKPPYEGKGDLSQKELNKQTASILEDRINILGISEPNITVENSNHLRVQLPGVSDQNTAREFLNTGGNITIRDTKNNLIYSSKDFSEVKIDILPSNEVQVSIVFSENSNLQETTQEYQDQILVFWLDYVKGDSYKSEISKEDSKIFFHGPIQFTSSKGLSLSSDMTIDEAKVLRKTLASGDLPAPIIEVYSRSVGATLGKDSLSKSIVSALVALVFMFIFLILRYRLLGLISVISLICYTYVTVSLFLFFNGTLTLNGIAAFILGAGIAVDANIIIFERIKEQKEDKRFLTKLQISSRKAFVTIFDSNVTSLIAALGLFLFGASIVRGFAFMLVITIVSSLLTTVGLSNFLLYLIGKSKL
jgi:preprotein translocase subunit SecD